MSISEWPKALAQRNYKDGEGLDSNPYPKGSANHDEFMMEMARLQNQEMKALHNEINAVTY